MAARGFVPVALTVCVLGALNGVAHFGASIVVLGATVALTAARPGPDAGPARAAAFLLATATVSVVALVSGRSGRVVPALFVLVVFAGTAGRGLGGKVAVVAQSVMFAFLALFIAPVNIHGDGVSTVGWALLAAVVAYGAAYAASRSTTLRPVRDDDAQPRVGMHVWRGVRASLSIGLAFVLGGLLFPGHQVWAVVAAFVIGVGTVSRGDAVLRGVQRTLGAALGTLGATLLASVVGGRGLLSVGLILLFLGGGLYLRQISYVYWAVAVTSVLALLYGLNGPTDTDLLGVRVLAGLLGGACAIGPAVFLAPIRTRAVVLKRAGAALRSIGVALRQNGEPDDTVRAAERDIAALRAAAAPLLVTRRFHRREEVGWVDRLTAARPDLRALSTGQEGARQRLARTTREVTAGVKAAAAAYRAG